VLERDGTLGILEADGEPLDLDPDQAIAGRRPGDEAVIGGDAAGLGGVEDGARRRHGLSGSVVRRDPGRIADRAELEATEEGEAKCDEAHVGSHDDSDSDCGRGRVPGSSVPVAGWMRVLREP